MMIGIRMPWRRKTRRTGPAHPRPAVRHPGSPHRSASRAVTLVICLADRARLLRTELAIELKLFYEGLPQGQIIVNDQDRALARHQRLPSFVSRRGAPDWRTAGPSRHAHLAPSTTSGVPNKIVTTLIRFGMPQRTPCPFEQSASRCHKRACTHSREVSRGVASAPAHPYLRLDAIGPSADLMPATPADDGPLWNVADECLTMPILDDAFPEAKLAAVRDAIQSDACAAAAGRHRSNGLAMLAVLAAETGRGLRRLPGVRTGGPEPPRAERLPSGPSPCSAGPSSGPAALRPGPQGSTWLCCTPWPIPPSGAQRRPVRNGGAAAGRRGRARSGQAGAAAAGPAGRSGAGPHGLAAGLRAGPCRAQRQRCWCGSARRSCRSRTWPIARHRRIPRARHHARPHTLC